MRHKKNLTPEQLKQLETMSGLRLDMDDIAAILGIGKSTLERMAKTTPAVRESMAKGRAIAGQNVRGVLYKMCTVEKDPRALRLWFLCIERQSTLVKAVHTGPGGGPVVTDDVSDLSDEELAVRYAALKAKMLTEG